MDSVLSHVLAGRGASSGQHRTPLVVIKKRKYDETPLALRYAWSEDVDPYEKTAEELQLCKVLCVERAWSMLFRNPDGTLAVLRCQRTPLTCAIECCSGEVIRTNMYWPGVAVSL
jgi:hypothetical protein